jgi:predicted nucleic acid-binding protein
MAAEPVLLDTSVLVAAAVDLHPSHAASVAFVESLVTAGAGLHLSPQICRELLVTLTRQPVSGRTFTIEEALDVLDAVTAVSVMLDETEAVTKELARLVERHDVRGKSIHDCNLVATMRAHGVRRLATRNPHDFKRYEGAIELIAVTS